MLRPQSLPIRSRNLYPAASMRNSGRISFDPARSAIVLATFSILEYARADNPSLPMRRSSTSLHPASRTQNLSNWRLLISAFVKIPSSPNLSFWSILALSTRSATAPLGSPFFRFTSFAGSTWLSHNCISVQLCYFMDRKVFLYLQKITGYE